jgi:hypothetical protein
MLNFSQLPRLKLSGVQKEKREEERKKSTAANEITQINSAIHL